MSYHHSPIIQVVTGLREMCVVWILQVWGGGRRESEGARRQARAQVGSAGYTHEKKRRWLLVSEGCPWCRASGMGYIVFRTTKGLKKAMTCSRLAPPKVVQKIHDLAVSAAWLIDHPSLAAVKLIRAVWWWLQGVLKKFRSSIRHGKELEAEVNEAMKAFEEQEAEEERKRTEVANTVSELLTPASCGALGRHPDRRACLQWWT